MSTTLHALLAVVLTLGLVLQLRALAGVLRSRRLTGGQPRAGDGVWAAIPVAVVLVLAARSWMIALDLGPPVVAAFHTPGRQTSGRVPDPLDPAAGIGRLPARMTQPLVLPAVSPEM